MLQSQRNQLFNAAYKLDNLKRVRVPKQATETFRELTQTQLDRARIQDKIADIYIIFTEEQLAAFAEQLRELAAEDERRITG